jgi:hypothetical protein
VHGPRPLILTTQSGHSLSADRLGGSNKEKGADLLKCSARCCTKYLFIVEGASVAPNAAH